MTILIIFILYNIIINERNDVKFIIFLQVTLLFFCCQIAAKNSTLVRIRSDVDSVVLKINDSLFLTDNYDNALTAQNWFIISLKNGDYDFVLSYNKQKIDTTITINNQESIALEFSFLQNDTEVSIEKNKIRIPVVSVPDSGFVTIDGSTLDVLTPTFFTADKDTFTIEVYREGYEPLVTDLMMADLQKKQVNFILKPMEPVRLNTDSLGFSMEKEIPVINILIAENIQNKYMGMAETFFIFPFAQGLIAKLALDNDNQKVADIMVGSGVILSTGSYLLSKILSNRKRKEIKEKNMDIERQNIEIKSSNKEIELMVRKVNAERKVKWEDENVNKGVVKITDIE